MELVNANHFVTLAGVGYLKSRVYGYRGSAAQLSRGQWGFGRPSKGYHGKMQHTCGMMIYDMERE